MRGVYTKWGEVRVSASEEVVPLVGFGWWCLVGLGIWDGVLFLLGWVGHGGGLGLAVGRVAA